MQGCNINEYFSKHTENCFTVFLRVNVYIDSLKFIKYSISFFGKYKW